MSPIPGWGVMARPAVQARMTARVVADAPVLAIRRRGRPAPLLPLRPPRFDKAAGRHATLGSRRPGGVREPARTR